MAAIEALDNQRHRDVRIHTGHGPELGEAVHFVPVVADELRLLVVEYPVFLMKDENTGQFGMSALLGFEAGQNLFLDGNDWRALYVPMNIRRQPFGVSVASGAGADAGQSRGTLALDMASRRVRETDGEALFESDGTPTPYLEQMQALIRRFMAGTEATAQFLRILTDNDLIVQAQLETEFSGGVRKRFDGLYTVDDKKLGALPTELLEQFHRRGYLQACYLLSASTANAQKLVALKNRLDAPT